MSTKFEERVVVGKNDSLGNDRSHSREGRDGRQAAFNNSLDFVLKHEGGLSTDKDDRGNRGGGQTYKGITSASLANVPELAGKSPSSLTDSQITAHYRKNFWNISGADRLAELGMNRLAATVFDTAVNMGVYRSKLILLKAAGLISEDTNISCKINRDLVKLVDAKFPAALDKLGASDQREQARIALKCCDIREDMYRRFAQNGKQSKFLKGWINRVNDMRLFIGGEPESRSHEPARSANDPRQQVQVSPVRQLQEGSKSKRLQKTHSVEETIKVSDPKPVHNVKIITGQRSSSSSTERPQQQEAQAGITDRGLSVFVAVWDSFKSTFLAWESLNSPDKYKERFTDDDSLEPPTRLSSSSPDRIREELSNTARRAAEPPPPSPYQLPTFRHESKRIRVLSDGTEIFDGLDGFERSPKTAPSKKTETN